MPAEPTIRLRPLVGAAATAVVIAGVWFASRQSLYISTGTGPGGVERSVNWWGLGIAFGLVTGGIGALVGVATKRPAVLIASGLLAMASGVWHPILWPAAIAALAILLLGASYTGQPQNRASPISSDA